MSTIPPTREPAAVTRRSVGMRGAIALVAIVVGITLVACSAPTTSTDADAAATSTSTTAPAAGSGPTSITKSLRATEIAGGFADPTSMVNRPMRNQLWIAERAGRVRVVQMEVDWNLETGQSVRGGFKTFPYAVLDISSDVSLDGERGLLGIAFSTDANTLFLDYVNRKGEIVVASWNVTDPAPPPVTIPPAAPSDPAAPGSTTTRASTTTTALRTPIPAPQVDERSRRVLLTIPHDGTSNYGGQIALGRDGFLYVGVGDSTRGTEDRTAQNTESLLGKLLRVDPAGATLAEPYAIPESNPFVNGGGAAPVFTIGVQDPLRFSFDRSNGDLWLGDAGDGRTQEIDLLTAASGGGRGANLGWPYVQGSNAAPSDAPSKLVTPILAYEATGDRCPVIGGYVYRGTVTELQGVYLYGDRCTGVVSGLLQRRGRVLDKKPMGAQVAANSLAAFGQDDQGEVYLLLSTGSLQRLAAQ